MNLEKPGNKKEHKVKRLLQEGIDQLEVKQNERLDRVEEYCKKALQDQDQRSRAIHGFLVREVQFNIANKLHDMSVKMDAFMELMADEGVKIEDFQAKLALKVQEVAARRQQEAEAKLQEKREEIQSNEEQATPSEEVAAASAEQQA